MKKCLIQCYEYQTLIVDPHVFTEAHFNSLAAYNDCHKNRYFVVGHNRITFQNYVGVICTGGLTIEILPKIDRIAADKHMMQDLLIRMLHHAGDMPLETTETASLKRVGGSLLDIYIGLFIREVKGLIVMGLPKMYSKKRSNEPFLRGRFLPEEQIRKNLIHKERNCIEYQEYSINHIFNRIIKKAMRIIAENPFINARDISMITAQLDGVDNVEISPNDFMHLHYTRNTECYRMAMRIAELIITGYQPDMRHGSLSVTAILFDMNLLFERYVAREIYRYVNREKSGITIKTQGARVFWRHDGTSANKTIRPDISLKINGKTFILDTKWKLLHDVYSADSDLKQLYTYSIQFESPHVYLLYPSETMTHEISDGYFQATEKNMHGERMVTQLKIPLLSETGLNSDLGMSIVKKLCEDSHAC